MASSLALGQTAAYQEGVSGGTHAETLACVIHDSGGDGTTTEDVTLTLGSGRGLIAFPRMVGAAAGQVPPGAQVVSATLELYVLSVPGAAATRTLSAHPVLDLLTQGPWHEPASPVTQGAGVGVSWLSRDSRSGIAVPWLQPGGDIVRLGPPYSAVASLDATSGIWVTLDVTSIVFAHVQGWSNQGWSLEVDQAGDDLVIASDDHPTPSLRPRLSVTWSGALPPWNAVPDLEDRAISTPQGVSSFVPFDFLDGDAQLVQHVIREAPQHGTLQGQGWYSYVPNPGYVGPDHFTLFAHDGFAASRVARVSIDVQVDVGSNLTTLSATSGTNAVRSTTVTISQDPGNQGSEEGTELLVAAGSKASFLDFPGAIGGAGGLPVGAAILSAQLELHVTQVAGAAIARTFQVNPLLDPAGAGPWFEPGATGSALDAGVSWLWRDARPGSLVPWLVPGGETDASRSASAATTGLQTGELVTFDVTAAVQAWALGAPAQGWRLTSDTADETRFASDDHAQDPQRPRLTVIWRGASSAPAALPPVAAAGPDRRVVANELVDLDASGSYDPNGDPITLLWSQISGPAITISDPTQPGFSFQAPVLPAEMLLEFAIVVNDGTATAIDNVVITVEAAPPVPNAPPWAEAGPLQDVHEGQIVLLNGSASTDPEGLPLTFAWQQVGTPAVILTPLSGTSRALLSAPPLVVPGLLKLHFQLTVDDGVHQDHDWVEIRVHPSPNQAPVALLSPNQSVLADRWVGLDARGSTDPDPYTTLSFTWTQLSGIPVPLYRDDTPVPYFKAPQPASPVDLVFQVTVGDGIANAQATTTVTVHPPPPEFNGTAQSLVPYPDTITPAEARHLLRRAGLSASPATVATVVAQGLNATVAQALAPVAEPAIDLVAWSWLPAPVGQDLYPQATAEEASLWWLTYMLESQVRNQLREKMAYFHHDQFSASGRVAENDERHWVMQHLDLFRQDPFPNYRSFLIDLTRDDLMLAWLNGHQNVAGAPNENYAREFWELFTLGEVHPFTGVHNYTEAEIQEAARALTGWESYDPANIAGSSLYSRFDSTRFDPGLKTFFGQTGPWNDADVVDITLARPEAAEFICYKLFRFFVHDNPTHATVQALAQVLTSSNWEFAPVVSTLLKSEAMFSPTARRERIKTPAELLLGFSRESGLRLPLPDLNDHLVQLGHELGNPPSVKGWEEGVFLLGAAASSLRAQAINALAYSGYLPTSINLSPFLPGTGLGNGPNTIARALEHFDIQSCNPAQFQLMADYMDTLRSTSGELTTHYFSAEDPADVDRKLRGLFFLIAVGIPEYQLN